MKKKEILKRHLVVRISEKQAHALLTSLKETNSDNISELVRRIIKDFNNKNKKID
jgi:hypothetical protein